MYDVHIDLDRNIIDTSLSGFLSSADVHGYVKAVRTALIMNRFYRGYRLIVDVSGCSIQSQETLRLLSAHIAAMPKAQRIAVVVGDSPASGQARRLFHQPYANFVPTRQEGLSWLLSDKPAAQPARLQSQRGGTEPR
jgi:hypothetical protein